MVYYIYILSKRTFAMEEKNRIPLSSLIKEFKLETIYLPREADQIFVTAPEVDRPGLALSGFLDIFEESRIQLIGIAEYDYLSHMSAELRDERIRAFVAKKPVVIMMTSGNPASALTCSYL